MYLCGHKGIIACREVGSPTIPPDNGILTTKFNLMPQRPPIDHPSADFRPFSTNFRPLWDQYKSHVSEIKTTETIHMGWNCIVPIENVSIVFAWVSAGWIPQHPVTRQYRTVSWFYYQNCCTFGHCYLFIVPGIDISRNQDCQNIKRSI